MSSADLAPPRVLSKCLAISALAQFLDLSTNLSLANQGMNERSFLPTSSIL
jgi:hypothetical protein